MKILKTSLLALSLLAALPLQAAENAAVPAAIAQHQGPVRIAVIRNLGSDDNTTQFLAGAIQEGRKLGFKVDTFLSNGDDARFGTSSTGLSARNMTASFSRRASPYSTELVKRIAAAGIAVAAFDTDVNGSVPGVTVSQQDDASLANASFGQLVKDFNGRPTSSNSG